MQENLDSNESVVRDKQVADSEPMLFMPYDILQEVRFQQTVKRAFTMSEFNLAHLDFKKLLAHLKTEIAQLQHDTVRESNKRGKEPKTAK